MNDSDFGTTDKRVANAQMLERNPCRDCGNKWWWDLPQSFVCTTCYKTHGKSSQESEQWKPKPLCNKCTELQAENLQMREALEKIHSSKGMTRLADCCVHKTCHPHSESNMCSFQTGVWYANADRAAEAEDALKTTPHTQKLADRIKALEDVAFHAKEHRELFRLTVKAVCNCNLCEALSKLDAFDKNSCQSDQQEVDPLEK